MQASVETTAKPTKKSSTGEKKPKKSTKASPEEEISQEPVVQEQASEPVVVQAPEPTVEVSVSQETVVLPQFDFGAFLDSLNKLTDEYLEQSKLFKSPFSKDERAKFETAYKKHLKARMTFDDSYRESLTKQMSSLEKNTTTKSSAPKKVQDKENAAINKKHEVQPFLLQFMQLDAGTQVSRASALKAITSYVKKAKLDNPSIIAENDKRSFKLIGDLKPLFDSIEKVMKTNGLLEGKTFPTQIKYTEIMGFMSHCFIKQ
jgi:hypothetical protein